MQFAVNASGMGGLQLIARQKAGAQKVTVDRYNGRMTGCAPHFAKCINC
jgi:hypothetical protein